MKNILTVGILIFTLCGVRIAYGQATASPYSDTDAYEVYSVILKDKSPARDGKPKMFVIRNETTDFPSIGGNNDICLDPAKGEEATYASAIAAYRELNKNTWLLEPKFGASLRYELVPKASINEIFGKRGVEGWKDFYAKYPESSGPVSLSAVGFNVGKMIAIVYMGHSCGGVCGEGNYHFLRKTGGKWSEVEWKGVSCTWAS